MRAFYYVFTQPSWRCKHNNISSLLINNSIPYTDEDYVKNFGCTVSNKTVDTNSEESSDVILEVGDNGVDISS